MLWGEKLTWFELCLIIASSQILGCIRTMGWLLKMQLWGPHSEKLWLIRSDMGSNWFCCWKSWGRILCTATFEKWLWMQHSGSLGMGETGYKRPLRSVLLKVWLANQKHEITWEFGKNVGILGQTQNLPIQNLYFSAFLRYNWLKLGHISGVLNVLIRNTL